MPSILSLHQFTDQQTEAVQSQDDAAASLTVVTAGAGSGKTRTLVGRYLALLESGLPLRSIVAITFTEKAAREMRSRIRQDIESWLNNCDESERSRWEETFAALDGARIGTIHALCAEILRAHPAEAEIDPDFDVLEENHATLLKARAIETALAWAATTPDAVPLFQNMTEHQLRQTLASLMEQRLDATAAFDASAGDPLPRWSEALAARLRNRLENPAWTSSLDSLTHLQARQPEDKLEIARREVLARWDEARSALEARQWDALFVALLDLRKTISTGGKKDNWAADDLASAREAMKGLRNHFDNALAPLLKKPVSWALDERCADDLPLLRRLFEHALTEYNRLKSERRALDFDDLEAGALALLAHNEDARVRWQSEIKAVLVDEFQDTNSRQQQIVYTLSGFTQSPISNLRSRTSTLFVVGDSKQSIYRFRGADVTVFRQVQADVTAAGGRHIELDRTFRAHAPLVALANDLLAPILGGRDDPAHPYAVPFAPLVAHREEPRPGIRAPHVEMHLGSGENADEGRVAAAAALARRLKRLHEEESVKWGEIALLFRASTGFPPYEDALERASIPFVTVAGRGFYDRPEVRDLLNALAALADPTDDLSLVGLLRSPAFALSDVALYLLRRGPAGDERRPVWEALCDSLDHLPPSDTTRARRAQEAIAALHELTGRTTVGNLLALFLNATHYRTALYLAGGQRLVRNVDKLLADAHRSGLVSTGEFLEYVQSLRDVAAREGEAPVEAGGAVQLMTVHKAKGLEFPVVVIADAARVGGGRAQPVLVSPTLGILPMLRDEESVPVTYRLASLQEADQEEAESRRLLYVAATRAQEKLVISGHVRPKRGAPPQLQGWLAWLGEVVGLDQVQLPDEFTEPRQLDLDWEGTCTLYPGPGDEDLEGLGDLETRKQVDRKPAHLKMIAPLAVAASAETDPKLKEQESEPPPRVWRVVPTATERTGPALVVGTLVHAALRHWRFPDWGGLEGFLRPFALEAGLTDAKEIQHAIAEASRLLARFQAHPLHTKLDRAERHHELPYSIEIEGVPKSGIVDLLCRADGEWTLVEFKTDELQAGASLEAHSRKKEYDKQVKEYISAVTALVGQRPRAVLVFLNAGGQIREIAV